MLYSFSKTDIMKRSLEICKAFDKVAKSYDGFAKMQKEIADRLLLRLSYLKQEPKHILDIGCGTGYLTRELKKRYPKAQVTGIDISPSMIAVAKQQDHWFNKKWFTKSWFSYCDYLQADMSHLPFQAKSFDLIISNQALHWSLDLPHTLSIWQQALKQDGCLMFTTLGPDSFKEIRQAWQAVDSFEHVNHFHDMHDIGDMMMHADLENPVLDVEYLSLVYDSVDNMLHAIKKQGVRNIHENRPKGLMGKRHWQQFINSFAELRTADSLYPLSYEIVYGHAWRGKDKQTTNSQQTFVPVSSIKKMSKEA